MKEILPKVSIVIPVYNGANFMREAINSALAQTYRNIEVIVVNDGSKDAGETEQIALSYGSRIRYFSQKNGGVATALNLGISNMEGEYFSWLSHDDMYTPDKIEKQVDALRQHAGMAIAFSDYRTISPSGKRLKDFSVSPKATHSTRALLAIGMENGLHGCSLLIPLALFLQYGMFDPRLRCTQDYDVWFRFARNVSFVHVQEILVFSRQHDEQDSKTKNTLCTKEGDLLHHRLIGELSDEEVGLYAENSVGYLIDAYNVYRNAGYEKTAARILRHICRLAAIRQEIPSLIRVLNPDVLRLPDMRMAEECTTRDVLPLVLSPKAKPRVLVFNNVWFRGGVERVVATLMNGLVDAFTWILVSSDQEQEGGFHLDEQIRHIRMAEVMDESLPTRLTTLSMLLDVDLVIGNPNIIRTFLPVYEKLSDANIKSIACNHGYYFLPYHYPWLHPIIAARYDAYRHASAVTWLTSFGANIYAQSAKNGALMPNPVTLSVSDHVTSRSQKTILCVGRFYDAVKRLDRVFEVFSRVLVEHSDTELLLVGGYDLDIHVPVESDETLRDVLTRLSIPEDKIRLLGEQESVGKYYAQSSVLMLTSESEGFSLVLAEAGQSGLPAVIFDVPGLDDIIEDGENGYVVPQGDLDGMALRVCQILTDFQLRENMGRKAKEMVRRFDQTLILGRWKSLIDTVLAAGNQMELGEWLQRDFMEPIRDMRAFLRKVAREYEANVERLLRQKGQANEYGERNVVVIHPEPAPCTTCLEMQQSLSWRVTKPLRWTKKLIRSLREHGLRITVRKVVRKFQEKFS